MMSLSHRIAEARCARCRMSIVPLVPIGRWTTPIDPIGTIGMWLPTPTRHPATMQSALFALSARVRKAGLPGPAAHVDGCEKRGGRDRAGIGECHSPGWETPC